MDNNDTLDSFATNLHQDILAMAEAEGNEALYADAFTQYMIDVLIEAGELQEGSACFYRARGMEVSGYGMADDGETLDLFITRYDKAVPPVALIRTEIEIAFRRMGVFLTQALEGHYRLIEEASPIFDMSLAIWQARTQLTRVRFFLFTDGVSRLEFKPDESVGELPVSYHIWDIQRLQRYIMSGQSYEPIRIDFVEEFGAAIPCLPASDLDADYQAYLAILPGRVLSSIYERYGPRLLELNVRSFLQARGKVNLGIQATIREEPGRFLAYNNGISATAQAVDLAPLPDGGVGIRTIVGLQIVNGGQTTASLYNVARKDKDRADLSKVFVQAKLTVVGQEGLDEIVPLISRYANSQNTVNEADFSANDKFHVRLEGLSRTVWAPATDGTMRQTKWFYERARGQYQDALAREGTPAKIKHFKQVHPNVQRFTKTDLAKFMSTWEQLPYQVSFGAQKNFREFTLHLYDRALAPPDERYFRQLVAKAILFRRAEKLVSAQNFGGYRANIVTYTIAWLVRKSAGRIDLERIWSTQDITPALADAIIAVSQHVRDAITQPPGGGNVTEWCKKKACWEKVCALAIDLSAQFSAELAIVNAQGQSVAQDRCELSPEEAELIDAASRIDAETWHDLERWARETGNFQAWQWGIAHDLGRRISQGRQPSFKQSKQGLLMLEKAQSRGYKRAGEDIAAAD